jgi:hypothetical protein
VGGDPASGSLGGNGSLIIQSGGTVNVAQDTLVYSDDLLWLDGGTLSTTEISFPTSELSITPGTFDWRSGTLHVGVFHGNLTVPSGGVLAPGNSLGSTVVFGDYEETPGAKLQIEIGGSPTSFQFDKLEVRGNVVLGGNLEISLLNGFVPTAANGYAILTPFSISGEFENVAAGERLMTSDALGSFIVNYGPGSPFNPTFVVLSDFRPLFPGDYNFDGLVDGADFLAWQRGGSPNPNSAADLALWSTNFGAGSSSALSTAAPEPRSIVGGVLALWATASWPRRRGSFLFATLRLGDSRDGGGRFDGSLW